jgi:hypothetical protein
MENFDNFKTQLLVHIQKSPLRAELEKKLEFDKELTDK